MEKDRRRQCLSVREHLVCQSERERGREGGDEWRVTEKEDRRLRKALKAFKGNEFYPLVDTMTREAFSWLCKYRDSVLCSLLARLTVEIHPHLHGKLLNLTLIQVKCLSHCQWK